MVLSCFAPILACGRSFFFTRPRASRPAPISVEEMVVDLAIDGEGVAPQPPPAGRWIDAIADPNFRAVQVMDAMRGSLQGTLWLHLAVKNSIVRAAFTPQYELFPIYWIKAGRSVHKSSLEDEKTSDESIDSPKICLEDFECIPEDNADDAPSEQVSQDDPLFGLCALCMEEPASLSLLPCRHDNFCQMCMLRIVCYWNQSHGPGCPICRTPIKTIVIIDDTLPTDPNADAIAAMFFEPQSAQNFITDSAEIPAATAAAVSTNAESAPTIPATAAPSAAAAAPSSAAMTPSAAAAPSTTAALPFAAAAGATGPVLDATVRTVAL